jgi:hypothetical protein
MQEHLQNLVSQGYMTVALLATNRVPMDPMSPSPGGGIHRGVLGVLHRMIWYTPASIPPLAAAVLWLGAASFDSFGDPTYCGLCNC